MSTTRTRELQAQIVRLQKALSILTQELETQPYLVEEVSTTLKNANVYLQTKIDSLTACIPQETPSA